MGKLSKLFNRFERKERSPKQNLAQNRQGVPVVMKMNQAPDAPNDHVIARLPAAPTTPIKARPPNTGNSLYRVPESFNVGAARADLSSLDNDLNSQDTSWKIPAYHGNSGIQPHITEKKNPSIAEIILKQYNVPIPNNINLSTITVKQATEYAGKYKAWEANKAAHTSQIQAQQEKAQAKAQEKALQQAEEKAKQYLLQDPSFKQKSLIKNLHADTAKALAQLEHAIKNDKALYSEQSSIAAQCSSVDGTYFTGTSFGGYAQEASPAERDRLEARANEIPDEMRENQEHIEQLRTKLAGFKEIAQKLGQKLPTNAQEALDATKAAEKDLQNAANNTVKDWDFQKLTEHFLKNPDH